MRLTLRTLLGYLDDILEPQQTRELGEKISESGVAAALVARIREVVRRRRILAPEVTGPGADPDPNLVSEYLDNTLPVDKIEDFERLCLESDVHLAEVASAHQILTMILGEPVDVASGTRERMYALGTVATPAVAARQQAAASAPPPVAAALPATTAREIPEYLTRGTQWRRLLPGAAAVLVVGLWLGLIFSDPTQSWRIWERPTAPAPAPAVNAVAAVDGAPADRPLAVDQQAPRGEAAAVAGVAPAPPATPPETLPTGDAAAALLAASTPPAPALPVDPLIPQLPNAAGVPTPLQPRIAPVTGPAVESKLLYNAAAGVLLARSEMGEWLMLPRRTLLHPGDELVSPEPFEAWLQVLDSDHEIVLSGGTRVRVLPGSDAAGTALAVDRGRVIFRRSATAPLPDVRPISLQLGDVAYTLELLSAGTECGLELLPYPSAGGPEQAAGPQAEGALYLTAGTARLTPTAGAAFNLDSTAAFMAFANGRPASGVQPLLAPPEWMNSLSGGAAIVAQQLARQFEESFLLNQPVDATIPALIDDRQPRISELAAKTIAMTDDYRGMVRALSAPHQESRQAGLNGLGVWIRRDPANAQLLADEFARVYTDPETGRRMLRLVWGYAPAEGRSPDVAIELVEWLRDANVGVREGAFLQIRRLTGGQVTFRYHPDGTESQRAAAVRQWENHVRKIGALVAGTSLPAETTPVPAGTLEPTPVEPFPGGDAALPPANP